MEKMSIWNAVCKTPQEAQKPIQAGRLKGFTDINPMWRFKVLTEQFGPCGIGWKYEIRRTWTESGLDNEIKAFCEVWLYIKDGDKWSEAIPGIGGSSFVTVERNGPYCSDECYKMALTDAISVCCKALGMSADIYYSNDRDKYTAQEPAGGERIATSAPPPRNDRTVSAEADRAAAAARAPQYKPQAAGQMSISGKPQCTVCGREIEREKVYQYSMVHFGRPMCYGCQQKAANKRA